MKDLEKQIKSISLNYSRQIAAIRSNSEEESATRNNLAEKMEKEISDAKIKFALDAEKNKSFKPYGHNTKRYSGRTRP